MEPRFIPASDRSLLVYTTNVPELLQTLATKQIEGVINLHPAYTSVLVVFDMRRWDHANLEREIRQLLSTQEDTLQPTPRLIEIPVTYDGPDLAEVARFHRITVDRVVQLHSGVRYEVGFLGFMPGFAYLKGLPDEIATPRLDAPRHRVEAGSVGIGGSQTGVYPFASPGGWRLIGRTRMEMFRADREPPSLLRIGDEVQFLPE
jgi:inhibitor of KinA